MRLTSFTDYAFRVLIYVAGRPHERATIASIASAFEISENHLTKVVHELGRAGFLVNTRGRGGGVSLARPASQIGIGEVVRSMEVALPAACFDPEATPCTIAPACRLRGVLANAIGAFHAALDRYTLADVVGNRDALARLVYANVPATAARAAS